MCKHKPPKKCVEKKNEEVWLTPFIFKIGSENFTLSKKPGYGICSIAFLPDDKYIVLSLTRLVETRNPILIVDSKTLAPLWLWYIYGQFQCSYIHTYPCRLAPRMWYLVVTGSSYRGNKYGIAIHTIKSGHLVSKNLWKGMDNEVNVVSIFTKDEKTQFVFCMNDTIQLLDIPTVNVSDYKTWKAPSPKEKTWSIRTHSKVVLSSWTLTPPLFLSVWEKIQIVVPCQRVEKLNC